MKALADGVVERFREHELLLRASAIAFQVLTAVVPFALFLTGAAGFAGLSDVYSDDLAPTIQEAVSAPAFSLINETFTDVLGGRHTFWATFGLALAIWQLSGAVRTVGASLDELYRHGTRPWRQRMVRSLWISATVVACITGALLVTMALPLVYGDPGWLLGAVLWLARYAIAAALLMLAIGFVVHHAPSEKRPVGWVSGGAVLVTVAWIAVTTAFGVYVTAIASYGSIYGVFVSVVVLLAWCYFSSLAFVAGIATDAELRAST
jgi:membrane protein